MSHGMAYCLKTQQMVVPKSPDMFVAGFDCTTKCLLNQTSKGARDRNVCISGEGATGQASRGCFRISMQCVARENCCYVQSGRPGTFVHPGPLSSV